MKETKNELMRIMVTCVIILLGVAFCGAVAHINAEFGGVWAVVHHYVGLWIWSAVLGGSTVAVLSRYTKSAFALYNSAYESIHERSLPEARCVAYRIIFCSAFALMILPFVILSPFIGLWCYLFKAPKKKEA